MVVLVEIKREALRFMLTEARVSHPRECCGILLGSENRIDQAIATRNVHPNPDTHFEIDPQALIDAHRAAREGGLHVAGYYHSHPAGKVAPSVTDAAMASGDGRIWAIIADEELALWCDRKAGFMPVSYRIVD
ncbi:Mov34/MPN/PAD-1 family protein [Altererythrobacter sp. GH1-8]|uniref:Mov34/MPN/PAD-1 family protein n=1 Tax=Altererythrobacter sp. GH1-8 TaxID=3349333 RepID=UPI00374D4749